MSISNTFMNAGIDSPEKFPWSLYLAPRFWPSWLGLAFMRLLVFLPYRWQLSCGKAAGQLFYLLAKYRREVAQTNIRLCFPELSRKAQEQLVRDHFHSMGLTITEAAMSWWGSEKKLKKLVHIENIEHFENALKQGKGAIILGAHYTTVEISGRLFTYFHELSVSYQKLRNPLFNQVLYNGRKRMFDTVFARDDIRSVIRHIRKNHAVWVATDQDAGRDNAVFAPFFGQLAATQTATSRLARITGAPVIPYFSQRLDNGRGYKIILYPALDDFPGDSETEDALRTNKLLEKLIRKAPEQYLWIHRRFKTRPEGMPKLYRQKPRRVRKHKKASA